LRQAAGFGHAGRSSGNRDVVQAHTNCWSVTENCRVADVAVGTNVYWKVPQFCQNRVFVAGLVKSSAAVEEPLVNPTVMSYVGVSPSAAIIKVTV
jgi:hypothetical protein